jgi:soluble lytic murein transglycosylase-like protein
MKQLLAFALSLCVSCAWADSDDAADVPADLLSQGEWVTLVPRSAAPPRPNADVPDHLHSLIAAACQRHGLDVELVKALIHVESRYQAAARSPKGAVGLMQIMPATAARYGVASVQRLFEPAVNIDVGTRYLRDLHDKFGHRVELVLAAYNAGEGAVARHGWQVPPFRETQAYVKNILAMTSGLR